MNSNKFIFKKKLNLKRKSKRRLCIESAAMFSMSFFLVFLNYLIPNKVLLLKGIPNNINESFILIFELFLKLLDICLVIFIFVSFLVSFILLLGSFYRLLRVFRRKTKNISYQ